MDNFGFEAVFGVQTNPLLVVEVKRPDTVPPSLGDAATDSAVRQIEDYLLAILSRLKRLPRRVVLTNGIWWLILVVPDDLRLEVPDDDHGRLIDSMRTRVKERTIETLFVANLELLTKLGDDIFRLLDFHAVTQAPCTLLLSVVDTRLALKDLTHRCWAVRIDYEPCIRRDATGGPPAHRPRITVTPVVMLRRADGAWFRVVNHPHGIGDLDDAAEVVEFRMPQNPNVRGDHVARIREHESAVIQAGDRLLDAVNQAIDGISNLPVLPLAELRRIERTPALPSLVEEPEEGLFWLIVGEQRHFIIPPPMPTVCSGHVASDAEVKWKQAAEQISKPRSQVPRCFHPDRHTLHCAQHEVTRRKAEDPLGAALGEPLGSRRYQNGPTVCRIFALDARHCCRSCAYLEVCLQDGQLKLPCQAP